MNADLAREIKRAERNRLEDTLAWKMAINQIPAAECQFVFAPPRRWRFDFAWPDHRMAVEVMGGLHTGGRHVRAAGYEADVEKQNAAVMAGWRVLVVTAAMIEDGSAVRLIAQALALFEGG